jgi:uncharacterized protein (DUF488 family)
LGNPRENRSGFRAGDPASRMHFDNLLQSERAVEALQHIAGLLAGGPVALMCFERQHDSCHRHLVAEALRRRDPTVAIVEV